MPIVAPTCGKCGKQHWSNLDCDEAPRVKRTRKAKEPASKPRATLTYASNEREWLVLGEVCHCQKEGCGHEWIPRVKDAKPPYCPKCKSRAWWK